MSSSIHSCFDWIRVHTSVHQQFQSHKLSQVITKVVQKWKMKKMSSWPRLDRVGCTASTIGVLFAEYLHRIHLPQSLRHHQPHPRNTYQKFYKIPARGLRSRSLLPSIIRTITTALWIHRLKLCRHCLLSPDLISLLFNSPLSQPSIHLLPTSPMLLLSC